MIFFTAPPLHRVKVKNSMTDSLQARWAHLISILAADPAVTARQRGFVNLAQPQGLMGSSRLIIEVPNKLTRAVFEEQISASFRAALHEALALNHRAFRCE